jgi:hypothetical protein
MKTVDAALIMSFGPCDDWPEERVREAVPKEIPVVDLLRAAHIPPQDRLWVALHKEFCSDSLIRLFACNCAERALTSERDAGREPDERSWEAVAVARRYARGMATDAELDDARAIALDAVLAAAWYAALAAAWYAARYAARAAVRAAARDQARYATWCAARAAARSDEGKWQCNRLAEMLEEMK